MVVVVVVGVVVDVAGVGGAGAAVSAFFYLLSCFHLLLYHLYLFVSVFQLFLFVDAAVAITLVVVDELWRRALLRQLHGNAGGI